MSFLLGASSVACSRLAVKCSLSSSVSTQSAAPSSLRTVSLPKPALAFPSPAFAPASSAAAIDPSSPWANVMCAAAANNTFNTQILVGETESTESVVRRFKKVCMDANIVQECRRRRYFETAQDIIKRKQKENARKRKRFQRSNGQKPYFFAGKDKAGEPAKAASATEGGDDDAEWNAM